MGTLSASQPKGRLGDRRQARVLEACDPESERKAGVRARRSEFERLRVKQTAEKVMDIHALVPQAEAVWSEMEDTRAAEAAQRDGRALVPHRRSEATELVGELGDWRDIV